MIDIAAELKDQDAISHLGYIYENGIGVSKNKKKSAYYYRKYNGKIVNTDWIWKPKYDYDVPALDMLQIYEKLKFVPEFKQTGIVSRFKRLCCF